MTVADPHVRLAEIAARQHGAFTLQQAQACGLADHQVRYQVRAGRWLRLGRGVFAVAGAPPTWDQRAMAALLARPDALLAGLAAAHAHGRLDAPLAQPTLVVPPGTSSRATIGVVRRLPVPPEQRAVIRGLRATTVARTLVDLAGIVPAAQLRKLVDAALGDRVASVPELRDVAAGASHITAAARRTLLEVVEIWDGVRPGSVGEARLLRSIDEWGLPTPDHQIPIVDDAGTVVARVDTGWTAALVGLEYDSIEWHGPARWLADEARHRLVEGLGWRLVHVGVRDLLPSSDLRIRLQRLLASRRVRPTPAA